MNKLFIVLLAVCLFSVVSAHTFVKRDAPTTPSPTAELTEKLNELKDTFTKVTNDLGKQIADSVNLDVINDLIAAASKTVENMKPAAEDAKPAAEAAQ